MTLCLGVPDLRGSSLGRLGPGAGLSRAECFALAAAARRLPGEWFTRRHEGRDHTMALVLPADEHDQRVPLFLIWRGARGLLYICMGHGAEATDLGCFANIADAAASMDREVRRYLAAQP